MPWLAVYLVFNLAVADTKDNTLQECYGKKKPDYELNYRIQYELPLKIVFLIRVKRLGTISTVLKRNFAENCDPLLVISLLRLFTPF